MDDLAGGPDVKGVMLRDFALFCGFTRLGGIRGGVLAALSVGVVVMSGFVGVTASQAATTVGNHSCYTNGTYGGVRVNIDPCRVQWYTNGVNISGTLNATSSSYEIVFAGYKGPSGVEVNSAGIDASANKSYSFSESFGGDSTQVLWVIYNTGYDEVAGWDQWLWEEQEFGSKAECEKNGKEAVANGEAVDFVCAAVGNGNYILYLIGTGNYPVGTCSGAATAGTPEAMRITAAPLAISATCP